MGKSVTAIPTCCRSCSSLKTTLLFSLGRILALTRQRPGRRQIFSRHGSLFLLTEAYFILPTSSIDIRAGLAFLLAKRTTPRWYANRSRGLSVVDVAVSEAARAPNILLTEPPRGWPQQCPPCIVRARCGLLDGWFTARLICRRPPLNNP